MQTDRLPKHLLIGFILAILGYSAFFLIDQMFRTRKGPWEVTFTTNGQGHATILIDQNSLGINDVQITFQSEHVTNTPGVVRFDKPKQTLPFGKTKFEDLTYLPGSVAFDFFGHEVELLPRTLYLNKKEHAWQSAKSHVLTPSDKLPPEAHYDPRAKKRRRQTVPVQ